MKRGYGDAGKPAGGPDHILVGGRLEPHEAEKLGKFTPYGSEEIKWSCYGITAWRAGDNDKDTPGIAVPTELSFAPLPQEGTRSITVPRAPHSVRPEARKKKGTENSWVRAVLKDGAVMSAFFDQPMIEIDVSEQFGGAAELFDVPVYLPYFRGDEPAKVRANPDHACISQDRQLAVVVEVKYAPAKARTEFCHRQLYQPMLAMKSMYPGVDVRAVHIYVVEPRRALMFEVEYPGDDIIDAKIENVTELHLV